MCAAGVRQEGSRSDFYETLLRDCVQGSAHLHPTQRDLKRIALEQAYLFSVRAAERVPLLVAKSLLIGGIHSETLDLGDRPSVGVWVRAEKNTNGAKLYLMLERLYGYKDWCVVVDSVPGVDREDWALVEPATFSDLAPYKQGSIVYSARIDEIAAADLLERHSDDLS